MDGFFRRGGVWYARLAIPAQLRPVLGKTEFLASTGVREPALGRVVAAELLAGWRRRLLDLSRILHCSMDAEQIVAGHPALTGGGYLGLSEAAKASGIDESHLLQDAVEGKLHLYYRATGRPGHLCSSDEFQREIGPEGVTLIVPPPSQMSEFAIPTNHVGVLRVRDARLSASKFIGAGSQDFVLFDMPGNPHQFFAPWPPIVLAKEDLVLSAAEVERVRIARASTITPAQIEMAKATKALAQAPLNTRSRSRVSVAVDAYMRVRGLTCNEDQARRIRGALDLFVELEGDPLLCDIDADLLETFRDKLLPTVPASENKVRLQHGTMSISESIGAVAGTAWPRLSLNEQVKRLQWIASMFAWLKTKGWIDRDPSLSLVKESAAAAQARRAKGRDQDARDLFTREDLRVIFSAGTWFQTGRGTLTSAGTYREFAPHYYWLPLLGLFTGARINELAQLHLGDIRQTPSGTWYLQLALLDDESGKKKRKGPNAKRRVPLHPLLLSLGLVAWRDRLLGAGYRRLFPELKHDKTKGFGKGPTKWFSSYLSRIGWERNGRKTFHSFRSTLVSECTNRLKLTPLETAQISGHARGDGTLIEHYVKDEIPDVLVQAVAKLHFNLPQIAVFDCDAGLQAVTDALARKKRGQGATEES